MSRRSIAILVGIAGFTFLTACVCIALVVAVSLDSEEDEQIGPVPEISQGNQQPQANASDAQSASSTEFNATEMSLAQECFGAILAKEGVINPEDETTIILLIFHLRNGVPPPMSVVDQALDQLESQYAIPNYRLRGYQSFWNGYLNNVNWERFSLTADGVVQQCSSYLSAKAAAEMGARNHELGGMIASEQAWRNAMDDWNEWQTQNRTREQVAQAEHEAWRTLQDAHASIQAARNELDQNWSP